MESFCRVSHVLKGLAELLMFTSRLASVYYAHANVTSEVFAVFGRVGRCVSGETLKQIHLCLQIHKDINSAKTHI